MEQLRVVGLYLAIAVGLCLLLACLVHGLDEELTQQTEGLQHVGDALARVKARDLGQQNSTIG